MKILVHGGGKAATQMASKLEIPVQMIDGRRVTDLPNLEISVMLYAGKINKQIVVQLQRLGCNALGLSGADGDLIRAEKRSNKPVEFGFVGDVTKVNNAFLEVLLRQQIVPVCCAISHDGKGQLLNTNADTIAAVIAKALSKKFETSLYYCFEKPGVLERQEDETSVIREINQNTYAVLKSRGIIVSGMLPKIDNCFEVLKEGVTTVQIGSPKMLKKDCKTYTKIVL